MKSQKYFAPNVKEIYKQNGGQPEFDENYTLFGQIFEDDLAVVRAISEAEANSAQKPKKQIVVESAKLTEYHAETE